MQPARRESTVRSDANYCARCSPCGFPYGEPGTDCEICGAPMQLTDEHIAMSRVLRNRVALAKQQRPRTVLRVIEPVQRS